VAIVGVAVVASAAPAQRAAGWDVTQPRGATREIDFNTDEGTWLSLDISPDGNWLTFDLLGHVYRMRTAGGEAESLTQSGGVSLNYHPRYSPGGELIAFISDRGGQDNLWIMDADGGNPRPVFSDLNIRAHSPVWTPDGEFIVVRRESLAQNQTGGTGLWMYHKDGGEGVQLVEDSGARWPSVSADGKHLYFEARTGGGDPLRGGYQIRRLELRTGKVVDITIGEAGSAAASRISSGGAFAPEVSPNGRWIAFGRQIPDGTVSYRGHRFGPRTALWLRDLETGAERVLMDPVAIAIESPSYSLGTLPRYAWAADGRSLILWQGGKIRRVDVATGAVSTIPFTARVQRTISEMAYQAFRISDDPFEAKFLRWHTAAPDGKELAFQAVGRIWLTQPVAAGGGERVAVKSSPPRRLTPASFGPLEYAPAWSPDGRWIAFVTRDDTLGGHLWKVSRKGGSPQRLTREPGEYVHPVWSPDGKEILVVRGAGATAHNRTLTHNPWWDLVRVPANGGESRFITRVALPSGTSPSVVARRSILQPSYGPEGRIFFPELYREGRQMQTALVSIAADGTDRRVHLTFPHADEIVPSPDGRWVAFQEGDNVYLTAMAWSGTGDAAVAINKRRAKFPVRQLSLEGGLFPRWRDGNTLEFGSGDRHFTYRVDSGATDTVSIELRIPRRIPRGRVALTGARIVTLAGDSVIERGTVVVEGSRIVCVGVCETQGSDRVLDLSGKTIIPGFVDMHSHHYREHRGFRPTRDYESAVYLAYGITTSLDNSMWSQNIFPTAELIEAGEITGPRTFSTGDPLYRGDAARQNEISSRAVADQNIERLKSWGAVSLKQYRQPRRDQRQWISDVAREKGLMVTAEGGDMLYALGMIMDGQTGWEHPLTPMPLYRDVATFVGQAGAVYSPTLVVGGPGPWNIEYFFAESDVWRDAKQQRFMPWQMLAGHLRRRMLRPETDYSFPLLAEGLKDIIAAGGYGALGSHGEHHGLAAHWEVWMLASALGPYGALEVASRHGAHFLGVEQDLGTIERGKLADLLVLDSNPLEDIRNTRELRFVMKGGVLYDASSLDEVWPNAKPFGRYDWVDEAALQGDDRPMDVWDNYRLRAGGAGPPSHEDR
jgi:Tol biopolymer transport system component/imidazolonepropionase-like amidohydrolase